MTTIVTRAGKGSALTWQEADANFTNLNNDKIQDIVQDLTPQLGGDLDVNTHSIVSTSNANINITPNGTGHVVLSGIQYPITDGTTGQVLTTNGSGVLTFSTASNVGALDDLTDVSIASAVSGQVLKYNGSLWINSTDNGITAISQDTTPSLGGNLDTASHTISSSTGNVLIDDMVTVDGIQFDTAAGLSADTVAKLVYDTAYEDITYRLVGNNVTIPIGQRQVQYIYNGTGVTLQKGQLVYVSGSQGNNLTVELADASSESTSSKTIGMVSETILNGANGFITVHGIADKIDTSLYTAGTALWLSTNTGLFTDTRPSAPNHSVFIGWVIRSHATTGSIYVHIQNGSELNELHDVSLSASIVDNSALIYNSSSGIWVDRTLSASIVSGLSTVATSGSYNDLSNLPTIPNDIYDLGITDGAADTLLKTNGAGQPSFTAVKTINGTSLIGTGNIVVSSGQGLGSITAYKSNGVQDDIQVNANTSLTSIAITQELLLDASAKIACETTSNYGWRDNIAPFQERTVGSNNPTFGVIRDGLQGLIWSATTMNQAWVDFHVDHDYALGTVLYPHVHWLPLTTGTGTVRWGIEYSVAKGHQQGASSIFGATTTVYVEQTISVNSQFMHFVAEVSQANAIPSTNVEPDSVIKMRVFRDAAHPNDTYAGDVHAWQSDLHYQFNTLGTLNRAPNFYGA